MLPSPRIFRSRWSALLWAGGIVWTALSIAGSSKPESGGTHEQVEVNIALAALSNTG